MFIYYIQISRGQLQLNQCCEKFTGIKKDSSNLLVLSCNILQHTVTCSSAVNLSSYILPLQCNTFGDNKEDTCLRTFVMYMRVLGADDSDLAPDHTTN